MDTTKILSKVPELTMIFWVVKILATTLGETAGDALSMSMGLGYLASTGVFLGLFGITLWLQLRARRFSATLYWSCMIATTTLGTTLADFADRSLGIGYAEGVSLLLSLVLLSLFIWHRTLGSVSVNSLDSLKAQGFYWVTIMFSQTLGTALGDWTADSAGLGYSGSAVIFASLLGVIALAYFFTRLSRTLLFWAAFVLTRPLGAVVGDFLDKPVSSGGLELSHFSASATLIAIIVICLLFFRQRAAAQAH
ncbi:hypothetical protein WG219_02010 [Ectopseudomonas mendocina]|uniref:Membrane-anchored protein n=1 Tax=Ectopseudomonas mendocina TaxID=300 RepID=A0ABZ2RNN8_ECTME